MTAPLRIAFDMTFPNRNPAGSGVYATELLEEPHEGTPQFGVADQRERLN